jgi:3,4-dihydroxy 2-butanone 4-phosphate synthase/GTP cyclohydrolase II
MFIDVYAAVDAIRRGDMVVVVDDEHREDEGDLVMAGEHVNAEAVAFMIRRAGGLVCAPCAPEVLSRLEIGLMVPESNRIEHTAFTVSVDHQSVGSGISADDRATTISRLADPASRGDEFCRPGHVFPLRARPGGVLERQGHTEAAIDLTRLAGLQPVAVVCELLGPDGDPLRNGGVADFATRHALRVLSVGALVSHLAERDGVEGPAAHPASGITGFERPTTVAL